MVALSSGKGSDISSVRSGTVHAARNAAVYYLLSPAIEMIAIDLIELVTGFALTLVAQTVAVREVTNATGMKGSRLFA